MARRQLLDSLPEEWELAPLGRSIVEMADGPFGSSLKSSHYVDEGVRVVRLGNIGSAEFRDDDQAFISREHFAKLRRHEAREGDLIVAGLGDENHALGRACVLPNIGRAIVKADCFRLRLNPRFHAHRYMAWFLSSDAGGSVLESRAQGATRSRVNLTVLSRVPVPYPPLEEQRVIADFLDRETAKVDQISKMKQSLIDRIQERRTTLVANALPGLGDVRFGRDGIPYVMTEWPLVRLGHVATVQTGMTLDAGRATGDEEVELPYLRVANVQDGWVDLEEVKDVVVSRSIADSSRLAPGDVLMTEGGDPDKLGRGTVWGGQIEECLHQNHVFAVRPSPDRLLSSYLALLTRTPLARTYFEVTASKTTGIASTSSGKIRSWRIPLPPVEEQEQAVRRVSERERILVEAIGRLQRQLDVLAERRQGLITAAVTGRLDVRGHVGAAS